MSLTRRHFIAMAAASGGMPSLAFAQSNGEYWAQWNLIFGQGDDFFVALGYMVDRNDPDMAAALIQAMRFGRAPDEVFNNALTKITGFEGATSWFDWMLWQEQNPQIVPHESFTKVKRQIFLKIDPNFDVFLKPEHLVRDKMKIRLEEITWGGVRKDGIPALNQPRLVDAADADYMASDDLVFGVSVNGDSRAYPLRIMGWHEMFNDVIGGVPLALAYCTLCGSGILFETERPEGDPLVFGSSGFLYRSNKLMFDRATHSLWNQFTGKPVSGPLVDSGIELKQRPVVIDTWENWTRANPDTKVLDINTGFLRDYGSGVVYNDYFGSPGLMFPATVDETDHRQKDYVFGVRSFGAAKAWPLKVFDGGRVINDEMAGTALVLIGDAATRSVRAYERGTVELSQSGDDLTSADGRIWTAGEDALSAEDGQTLPRVAGHIAYWFAWDGYLGDIGEVYTD